MLKQPSRDYRGFRTAGIRLREEMLPQLTRLSAGRTHPMLAAMHAFDKAHAVMLVEEELMPREAGVAILRALRQMEKEGVVETRARVGGGGSFAASPVAADGRLYLANEDGDVFVVRAGRAYEELTKNPMKEVIMGTPAIADGLIVIRTLGHVYGVGESR